MTFVPVAAPPTRQHAAPGKPQRLFNPLNEYACFTCWCRPEAGKNACSGSCSIAAAAAPCTGRHAAGQGQTSCMISRCRILLQKQSRMHLRYDGQSNRWRQGSSADDHIECEHCSAWGRRAGRAQCRLCRDPEVTCGTCLASRMFYIRG